MKLSVIVPVYNNEKLIARCVNSILNQNFEDLEVIIVNDGSTDRTKSICEKLAKNNPKVNLITISNNGVSNARNEGLKLAKGDYIGFVDSDDFIDKNMFNKLLKAAFETNAEIVECGYIEINVANNSKKDINVGDAIYSSSSQILKKYFMRKNSTSFVWNKIYKSDLIKKVNFSDYKYSEDYLFNVEAILSCRKKVSIDDCLYNYWRSENSVTYKALNPAKFEQLHVADKIINITSQRYSSLTAFAALFKLRIIIGLIKEINNSDNAEFTRLSDSMVEQYREIFERYMKTILLSSLNLKEKLYYIYFYAKTYRYAR